MPFSPIRDPTWIGEWPSRKSPAAFSAGFFLSAPPTRHHVITPRIGGISGGMAQLSPAPFLRDPITVSRKELIEHYPSQAGRYRQLAERQQQSSIHDRLVGLTRQCAAMADALAGIKRELSQGEIVSLLNDVLSKQKSVSSSPESDRPQPPSLAPVAARELSLDEIIQKVQRHRRRKVGRR